MNQVFKYFVGLNMEHHGLIEERKYWTNDESQAVQVFNELNELEFTTRVISFKRWDGENYSVIKIQY